MNITTMGYFWTLKVPKSVRFSTHAGAIDLDHPTVVAVAAAGFTPYTNALNTTTIINIPTTSITALLQPPGP